MSKKDKKHKKHKHKEKDKKGKKKTERASTTGKDSEKIVGLEPILKKRVFAEIKDSDIIFAKDEIKFVNENDQPNRKNLLLSKSSHFSVKILMENPKFMKLFSLVISWRDLGLFMSIRLCG